MDITSIIVACISMCGTLVGTYAGIRKANSLTNYRIQQLENKVNKHMLDDAVKKEPYNNNEVKFKADAVISMVLDIIHQNIREDADYRKISEGVINENVQI